MSKKLCVALAMAGLGVSVAGVQIHRFLNPPTLTSGRRFQEVVVQAGRGEVPHAPPRMPHVRTDAALAHKLDLVHDYINQQAWVEAAHVLQALLEGNDDTLVSVERVGKDDEDVAVWAGLRTEAGRLLSALPAAGRDAYQTIFGPRAQTMLAEARRKGDVQLLGEVVRRYLYTAAGVEALGLLGTHHLDRGRHTTAALCFDRLLERADAGTLPAPTLAYAAFALRAGGNAARADEAWKQLVARHPGPVQFGSRSAGLDELKKEIDRAAPTRQAAAPAGVPGQPARWSQRLAHEDATRRVLDAAAHEQEAFVIPSVPGFVPLAADDKVIYRSHRGLHAVDGRTGRTVWEAPSQWSLDAMLPQASLSRHVQEWVGNYTHQNSPHVLLAENAVIGQASTDGRRVYVVDDLAVPPYRATNQLRGRQPLPEFQSFGPELDDAAHHNRLLALDVATGKLAWSGELNSGAAGPVTDTYFLGSPLPLDGRLYVLAEKEGEIKLLCLDSAGAPLWGQSLALAPSRLLLDLGRRIQAARAVYADGILVCPTYTGVLVGVDLLHGHLAWAYPYLTAPLTQSITYPGPRRPAMGPPQAVAEWKAPLIQLHQGRAVFAAPDGPAIHCVNLRDGALVWKEDRADDDIYLAGVFDDRVLVVGKKRCRALDLADGKVRWEVETGLPSGQGAADGHTYYLPLRLAAQERGPAIYAIDVRSGTITARSPRREVPGNLVFWHGDVVSQTSTAISAYPGRKDGVQ